MLMVFKYIIVSNIIKRTTERGAWVVEKVGRTEIAEENFVSLGL